MVTVYSVEYRDYGNEMGSSLAHFRKRKDAEAFAAGRPGPHGSPVCVVIEQSVPRRIAARWGVC
jgi:hypothetical protein